MASAEQNRCGPPGPGVRTCQRVGNVALCTRAEKRSPTTGTPRHALDRAAARSGSHAGQGHHGGAASRLGSLASKGGRTQCVEWCKLYSCTYARLSFQISRRRSYSSLPPAYVLPCSSAHCSNASSGESCKRLHSVSSCASAHRDAVALAYRLRRVVVQRHAARRKSVRGLGEQAGLVHGHPCRACAPSQVRTSTSS